MFKNDAFRKQPNKGFCGISLEVMDIYPVIKHAEKKFLERLAASDKKCTRHYEEVADDRFNHLVTNNNPPTTLQNDTNHGAITVEVHNTAVETQNGDNTKNGDKAQIADKTQDANESKPIVEVPPTRKRPPRLHKYDVIDESVVKGHKDYTIYEALDLAPFKHRPSMMTASFTCDSQAVDALDLDKQLRYPSMNSISSGHTYKPSSTISSPRTSGVLNDIRVPYRPSFSTDSSYSPNVRFQRASSKAHSGTTGSSFKSNDLLTASFRSQRSR